MHLCYAEAKSCISADIKKTRGIIAVECQCSLVRLCSFGTIGPIFNLSWSDALLLRITTMAGIRRFSKFAMVDVGAKPVQRRTAKAVALVHFPQSIWSQVLQGSKKGDAVAMAEIAGIQGAKAVPALLPMCHTLALDSVRLSIQPQENAYRVESTVTCHGKTGVEMEALTAVSAASLCLYDCFKYLSSDIKISEISLLSKTKHDL